MKAFLAFCVILLLCPSAGFPGRVLFAKEHPGLLKECKFWKPGNRIPPYLLVSSGHFNHLGPYTPSNYIRQIENKELLFALMIDPIVPKDNYDFAFERLLGLCGLHGFKTLLEETAKENRFRENAVIKRLRRLFSGRCIKVYNFFIDKADMPKDEALKVLSAMKTEIGFGQDIALVYKKYSKKYEYLQNPKYPDFYVTKVGNGGEVCISGAKSEMFPPGRARCAPKVDIKKLLKLNLGESIILEESATPEDRELSRQNIFTETQDAWNLCVVIDEFPPHQGAKPRTRPDPNPSSRMGIKMNGTCPV